VRSTNRVKMWRFVWNLLVINAFESGIGLAMMLQGYVVVVKLLTSGYVVRLSRARTTEGKILQLD